MVMRVIRDFVKKLGQKGQGIVEYALILAFVVAIAAYLTNAGGLGTAIQQRFNNVAETVNPTQNNNNNNNNTNP